MRENQQNGDIRELKKELEEALDDMEYNYDMLKKTNIIV